MISQKAQENRDQLVKDLVEAMKNGTAPWQQPWTGDMETPFNAASGRHYHGVNFVRLSMRGAQMGQGGDPRWCTFEQAKEKGWHIKPGSKGTKVEFYKFDEKPKTDEFGDPVLDEEGKQEVQRSVIVRNYVVFHASQIEGIEPYEPKVRNAIECNEKAERILKESGADIRHGGNEAFYARGGDYIQLPAMEQFNSQADYYSTALHELTHWTGHPSRLNRESSGDMKSEAYAREELVAEIGSMFVSAETGIPQTKEHLDNHAAYVESWIKAVEEDPNALFRAVSQAQKASEEILKHERVREQAKEQLTDRKRAGELYEPLNGLGRLAYIVKEAKDFEKAGQQKEADALRDMAIRQGVFCVGKYRSSSLTGFYNIFKLRDVMTEAGLEPEKFDPLLKHLRDTDQIQLLGGNVTIHSDAENARNFIDENGLRLGTFTFLNKSLEDFEVKRAEFEAVHPEKRQEVQRPKRTEKRGQEDVHIAARSALNGDPVPLSVLTEKAIRDLHLVEGEPRIFLKPRLAGQTYKGEIRRVDEKHGVCFQQVGKQSLVLHHLEKIEGTPKVGEAVKIAYDAKGEKAKLSVQEERQERHRGLHR